MHGIYDIRKEKKNYLKCYPCEEIMDGRINGMERCKNFTKP